LKILKMSILHFRKQLAAPPVVIEVPGIRVRTFVEPEDTEPWLAVRARATAGLAPPARQWSIQDFHGEMTCKSWWRAEWTWLAVNATDQELVGAVTLALREGRDATVPVVHWVLVDPEWRHRGVARELMSHLELAAWKGGHREVQLETHAHWKAAVGFYQSIGYVPLRARSPR
jgi:GNAT superfamily N-acetyltransferase